jgi:ribonucleoside-diphosphate reductase alpha chain
MEEHEPITPKLSQNAIAVLEKRYLRKDKNGRAIETPAAMFRRVAEAIAQADRKFEPDGDTSDIADRFYDAMAGLEFLPNSPTLMNAGRELGQLSACFVLPVGDSMDEIFDSVKHTALIHKSGGGTGFSFSNLRPKNDVVQSTTGISSGPISFMRVFDIATETVKQGGTRRGANMGLLRVDHPDILEFIRCKSDQKHLNNFNISVGITDAFMEALEKDGDYTLVNPRNGEVTGKLNARKVFDRIVHQARENGEPGIIFLDRMNRDNPTPHVGVIESTNPCGEQPLLPYESCNLGSINLGRMVKNGYIDWERITGVVHLAVHFLDNVIDLNRYPLPQIAQMTQNNRKIGLGVMGWADMLIALGIHYDSPQALELAETVMKHIQDEGYKASQALAAERGAFPNFKGSTYDKQGMPPMRNATVTTIAPTGTISIIANASSGIEPLYSVVLERKVMDKNILVEVHPLFEKIAREGGFYSPELVRDIAEKETVRDIEDIPEDIRNLFVTAHDLTPEVHVAMQAAFQRHTDNAVSKTVNLPHDATPKDVEKTFLTAFKLGSKGLTVYRNGSRDNQVLRSGEGAGSTVKRGNTTAVTVTPRERPEVLNGSTFKMPTGCGPLYINITKDKDGPFEVFTTMGKAGGCAASQCEAIGRLVSLALRSGVPPEKVARQLMDISCHSPYGFGEKKVLSCADAVAKAIRRHLTSEGQNTSELITSRPRIRGACPECGGQMTYEIRCPVCRCGYSECS